MSFNGCFWPKAVGLLVHISIIKLVPKPGVRLVSKSLTIFLLSLLCGCTVYKIDKGSVSESFTSGNRPLVGEDVRIVEGKGVWDETPCSFGFAFLITLGLFPMHCVTTYDASILVHGGSEIEVRQVEYRVTTMQSWFLFPMPIVSGWKYELGNSVESEIRADVLDGYIEK